MTSRALTAAERAQAQALEARLRPVLAAVISAAGGGTDSHGHPVPGLGERLARVPADLEALAAVAKLTMNTNRSDHAHP